MCVLWLGLPFFRRLGSSAYETVEQDGDGALFHKGDTNTPLLVMDWFNGPGVDQVCRVTTSGKVFSARHVINWATQGSHRIQLDETNLQSLIATINALPLPPKRLPPKQRWLAVRGIRTNQWFKYIYDRADVPQQVEKLYDISGAYLEWSMPDINGHQLIHSDYGNYHTSQAGIGAFRIATRAPIAVSAGVNGITVWDLKKNTATPLLFLKGTQTVDFENPWTRAAISPDGKVVAFASYSATLAVDWRAEKILWQARPLIEIGKDSCLNLQIAIGGNKGQFLFVAGAHKLERWDLATGTNIAVLAVNQPTVQLLESSRDGNVLLAGFSDLQCMSMPTTFKVWKSEEDLPSAQIAEPESTGVGISPDGQTIALSVFGEYHLLLWKWKSGAQKVVPLRTPYASRQAYSMQWSPDNTRVAANVDTYPASIVVYDTMSWKPLAHWQCGQVMSQAEFGFEANGTFLQLRDHDISGIDVVKLNGFRE